MASTIQWVNLCLETAFPFCWPPWQTNSCSELLKLWVQSTYMRNALTGHSNAKAGSVSSEGSAFRYKGAPLKSRQDDREVPRGHKRWPGGIHPPGPLQEPHDAIMLSQGPTVHCIVVSRDSGHIHFQGGGWQPTLQPFLQEIKHYSNRASSGVFSARRTPVREQTTFQCVGLPCWRSSSLSDGLYHCRW